MCVDKLVRLRSLDLCYDSDRRARARYHQGTSLSLSLPQTKTPEPCKSTRPKTFARLRPSKPATHSPQNHHPLPHPAPPTLPHFVYPPPPTYIVVPVSVTSPTSPAAPVTTGLDSVPPAAGGRRFSQWNAIRHNSGARVDTVRDYQFVPPLPLSRFRFPPTPYPLPVGAPINIYTYPPPPLLHTRPIVVPYPARRRRCRVLRRPRHALRLHKRAAPPPRGGLSVGQW